MGEVTISVAGRAYQVVCEDGEEDRLTSIAARVDQEAQAFGGATPSLSEARLLLMCSLLLADKLDEAEKSTVSAAPAPVDTSAIEEAAARLEALAGDDAQPDIAATDPSAPVEDDTAPEAPQSERRSKSSAATAAEKDLLSMLDRPEARPDAEIAGEAESVEIADTHDPVSADAPEPAETGDPAEGETPSEPEEPAEAEESEEERAARERSERRARRRERLARLAKQSEKS